MGVGRGRGKWLLRGMGCFHMPGGDASFYQQTVPSSCPIHMQILDQPFSQNAFLFGVVKVASTLMYELNLAIIKLNYL
jgi:hypothetical protein